MYFIDNGKVNVFLVHPGGPFWKGKDEAAWGIPKGRIEEDKEGNAEKLIDVARREFQEETGIKLKENIDFIDLSFLKRKNGKKVYVWAFLGNGSEKFIKSNETEVEWPHKSGKIIKVPEVDKAKYFEISDAKKKIHIYQQTFLDRLKEKVKIKQVKQDKLF